MKAPERIYFVLFNEGMFAATGEVDKPVISIELTEQQKKEIEEKSKNYSILTALVPK